MTSKHLDDMLLRGSAEAAALIQDLLEPSIEYAVIGTDLEGRILLWNDGAKRLFGYEPGAIVGLANVAILHSPEDPEAGQHRELRRAALRDGHWEGTGVRLRENGECFTAREVILPRREASGRPTGFLIVSRDVSDEIRLAVEELRRSRERLALALEAEQIAHFASWQWDLRKDVADWSEEMYAIFGRERSFVPTLETSLQSMHPEDRASVEAAVRQAIAERSLYDLEYRIVRPDGSIRFIHAFGRAHYDDAGTPMRMVGALYDITERKRAEEGLARSERRFRALFETTVDPILLVNGEQVIIGANPAVEAVTGLPGERILHGRFDALIAPENREAASAYVRDLLAGGPVKEPFELVIAGGKGRRILEVYGRPIREPGSSPYVQLVARDVTEQREITRRLMDSERQASIGQVASFVAHEVNNPLTNIALLTAVTKRMVQDPEAQAKLDKIDDQRKVAGRIISELLDLTRARQLNVSQVDLRSVVEDAVEQVAALRRPEVSLDLTLGGAPVPARVDPLRMSQAICNLVKNAFQATERGSVRIRIEGRPKEVAILVSDSGPGIAPEVRARLFRSFFTTKARGEGTGLGLLFADFVVAAHGGRIDVTSEPGQGATFTVLLPHQAAGTPAEWGIVRREGRGPDR